MNKLETVTLVFLTIGVLAGYLIGYRNGKHAGLLQGYDEVSRVNKRYEKQTFGG